jgi:beta-galactosidase
MLDRTVTKRPLGWQRQSWWSDKPLVYLARRVAPIQASPTDPGWDPNEQTRTQNVFGDWTPRDPGPHDENVEVYSNCDEVELFLNGRSLGSKPKPANDSPRNWIVPFESGAIRAVCTRISISSPHVSKGSALPSFELRTAGKPAAVKLSINKSRIVNDWDDVVFVTAEVVDANGVLVPSANDLIRFDATGSGFIAAVDSADNADHDPFQAKQRKAFQGRNIALVKANRSGGKVNIMAEAAGLMGGKITIDVDR